MPLQSYLSMDQRTGFLQEANPPQVPVASRNIPGVLAGERGSQWDQNRLFEWFEEGLIFLQGPVEDFEIEAMLKTDGKARAVEQVLTLPIRGAKWVVDANDAPKAVVDYVVDLLERPGDQGGMSVPFGQIIAQATAACLYRSACFEKVYQLDPESRAVTYAKLAYRPPTTCYLARSAKTAELEGFLQWTWTDVASFQRIYIPRAKSFVYLHGTHRDPILGSTDMDVVYRAFQTKQKLRFLWASYLENQVLPKLAASVNTGDQQQAASLAKKAATLRNGAAVGLTQGQTLTPIAGDTAAGAVFQQAIAYCDEEMYSSILANFLALATASGVRGGGSFALSLSQTDFYLQSRQAVLAELAEQITHQVIAPMVRWNFGRQVAVPKFRFVSLASTSNTIEGIVQMVQALVAVPPKPGSPAAVPAEFVDELVRMTAGMFGMDTDKIGQAVDERHQTLADAYAGKDLLGTAVNTLAGATLQGGFNGTVPIPAAADGHRPPSPPRPTSPPAPAAAG